MFQNKPTCMIILLFVTYCMSKNYSNYMLCSGYPIREAHLEFLKEIGHTYDIIYWRPPGTVNKSVEFIIGPSHREDILKQARLNGISLTTIIQDIQRAFDEQTIRSYIRRNIDSFNWQSFYRLKDIYDWLRDLNRAYPHEIQLQSIGRTFENRHIMSVRIALKNSEMRSSVIIEGGTHAREWIAPTFVTYLIHTILHAPDSEDELLKKIALTYEWHFVPVLNPDGYEYSHTQDRMWRKNRQNNYGVDVNRNFDIDFGGAGVSFSKSSDSYCGNGAFSERESSALAEFVKSKSRNLEYYFAFHSYGQYIIIPYAHLSQHVENFDEMKQMGIRAASRIAKRYQTKYTVGTAKETVGYFTSGVSDSWVKKTFRVPYVATVELRDNGHFGFALPPKDILPTCEETLDGMLSMFHPQTGSFSKLKYTYNRVQGWAAMDKLLIYCDLLFLIVENLN